MVRRKISGDSLAAEAAMFLLVVSVAVWRMLRRIIAAFFIVAAAVMFVAVVSMPVAVAVVAMMTVMFMARERTD